MLCCTLTADGTYLNETGKTTTSRRRFKTNIFERKKATRVPSNWRKIL